MSLNPAFQDMTLLGEAIKYFVEYLTFEKIKVLALNAPQNPQNPRLYKSHPDYFFNMQPYPSQRRRESAKDTKFPSTLLFSRNLQVTIIQRIAPPTATTIYIVGLS